MCYLSVSCVSQVAYVFAKADLAQLQLLLVFLWAQNSTCTQPLVGMLVTITAGLSLLVAPPTSVALIQLDAGKAGNSEVEYVVQA